MKRKFGLIASLMLSIMLIMAPTSFAASGTWTIYYDGDDKGQTIGHLNNSKNSYNEAVAFANTECSPYTTASAVSSTHVTLNTYVNSLPYSSGSTNHPGVTTVGVLRLMGTYNSSNTYRSASTHYVMNIGGVKTGYGTLVQDGVSV